MIRWLGPSLLAALSLACGESRLLDDFSAQATRLRLLPESFRGNVPCVRGAEGALQMYAVIFRQARENELQTDAGLFSQTSAPVPCDRSVLLDAVPGLAYVADIYGFDRAISGPTAPLGEARWFASCGRGEGDESPDGGRGGPTRAIYGLTVPLTNCSTFSGEGGDAAGTRLLVDQESALGDLRCGTGPGLVSRLEGVLEGQRVSARCGDPLAFSIAGTARFYNIELTGFEARPGAASPGGDPLDASVGAPAQPDAAVADAGGLDAGGLDAGTGGGGTGGTPPVAEDGGISDAGADPGIARWRTQCLGRASPGVTSVATCDLLIAF